MLCACGWMVSRVRESRKKLYKVMLKVIIRDVDVKQRDI